MRKATYLLGILLMTGLIVAAGACTPLPKQSETITDYSTLLSGLRASGISVTEAGQISQPFFSVKGRVIKINGSSVWVYEYGAPEAMEAEAQRVSRDGFSITTTSTVANTRTLVNVEWIGPPHFYKAGRIMAIYVGTDETIIESLKRLLGEQFAGA